MDEDQLVGTSLSHFRITERLGRGGMGVVYRAHDEKLRRDVALKVLPPAFAQDPERRQRFLREARSAAAQQRAQAYLDGSVQKKPRSFLVELSLRDAKRARELARKVIEAWGASDADVPAVAQMRQLLERLP